MPVVFLMTDNQIVNENFLVFINDLLANGDIPDLCTQEDKDNFNNTVGVGCPDWAQRATLPASRRSQQARAMLCLFTGAK